MTKGSERRERKRTNVKAAAKIYLEHVNNFVSADRLLDFMNDVGMLYKNEVLSTHRVYNVLNSSRDSGTGRKIFRKAGYDDRDKTIWELNPNVGWDV